MHKHEQNSCPFGDDIISYMYNEMPTAAQFEFEQHLVACEVCTDDFAAVSLARFETYDWKRIEFDPLPTPEIMIPYPQKAAAFGERMSAWVSWATVVPVAAVLLTCLGLVYILVLNVGSKKQGTIAEAPRVESPSTVPPSVMPVPQPTDEIASKKTVVPPAKVQQVVLKRKTTPPRSTFARRPIPTVRLADDYAVNTSPSQIKPAPRLGMKDEEDDRSLRLADLFDETKPPLR